MEDAPTSSTAAAKKSPTGVKSAASHPPVASMVVNAIESLHERNGSSSQAIKKFISNNYDCDVDKLNIHIKRYLNKAVEKKELIQTSGRGATGSFKMNKADAKMKKPVEKPQKVEKAKKTTNKEDTSENKKTQKPETSGKENKPAKAKSSAKTTSKSDLKKAEPKSKSPLESKAKKTVTKESPDKKSTEKPAKKATPPKKTKATTKKTASDK